MQLSIRTAVTVVLAVLLTTAGPAAGAVIELDDGRTIVGEILRFEDGMYFVRTGGEVVAVPRDRTNSVHSGDDPDRRPGMMYGEPMPEGPEYRKQLESTREKLTGDEDTMRLIEELRDDPEMQAILSDPEILRAVERGDIAALLENPKFQRLMENATVRDIQRKALE
ncbi:MAG: hypothetical protein ACLFOY_13005 [Desulfatibacillaceae bacterium]